MEDLFAQQAEGKEGTCDRGVGPSDKPYFRPIVTGAPLNLASDPTLPKPVSMIEFLEPDGGLRLEDRKLLNMLMALSWVDLGNPDHDGVFQAQAIELRNAIGKDKFTDNRRLRASLTRLMRTLVEFPRVMADGNMNDGLVPLLSLASLPKGEGVVEWEFSKYLRPQLEAPSIWARLHLSICAKFKSKYGLVLYELLTVRAGLRNPFWIVEVDELRALLGVKNGKLKSWDSFYRSALKVAFDEVRKYAPMDLSMTPIRAPGQRSISKVRFNVSFLKDK